MNERRHVSLGPVDRLKAFGEAVPPCDVFGSVEGAQCVVVPLKPEENGRVLAVRVDLHRVGKGGEEEAGKDVEVMRGLVIPHFVPRVRIAQNQPRGTRRIARSQLLKQRRSHRIEDRIGTLNFDAFGEDVGQRINPL